MQLTIQHADDALIEQLLPRLNKPVILLDFRLREEKAVSWQGDDLPVYHSYDALAGLCDWEDVLYDTKEDGVMAAYPPPNEALWPEEPVLPPFSDCLYLTDDDRGPESDETVQASLGAKRIAARWNQEQGILDRLLFLFKGKHNE